MKKTFLIIAIVLNIFAAEPVINGFFIQPSLGYGGIDYDGSTFATQQHFDDWVKSMSDVGADMLFYQWTAHYWGNQKWYTDAYNTPKDVAYAYYDIGDTTIGGVTTQSWVGPTTWPGHDITAIEKALSACETNGVKLWLGLYLNEDSQSHNWWDAVSNSDITSADSAIIKHHIDMCNFMVDDLYAKFGDNPAFGGFYYPVEVANLCFYPEKNWDELAWLISSVADRVHTHDPNLKLAISPFFNTNGEIAGNGLGTAKEYGAMWEYALAHSNLDVLILQDGVGVDPQALTDSVDLISAYYRAAKTACDNNGVQFWANSELFTNAGTRMNPKFYSTNMKKLEKQLRTENTLAKKSVCFSFHYMDPNPLHTFSAGTYMADSVNGPTERLRLYNEYKAYLDTLSPTSVNYSTTQFSYAKSQVSLNVKDNALHISVEKGTEFSVAVMNVSGKTIVKKNAVSTAVLPLEHFPTGIYFCSVKSNGIENVIRFIKK